MANSSQQEPKSNQQYQSTNNNDDCEVNNEKLTVLGLIENHDRGLIGAASDNIWNLGVGAVKGIGWTFSTTYDYSIGLLNRSYSLKMKDKNE